MLGGDRGKTSLDFRERFVPIDIDVLSPTFDHGATEPIWIFVDLAKDTELTVSMVPQPATYKPSPLELMPQEQPILPEHRRAVIDAASD